LDMGATDLLAGCRVDWRAWSAMAEESRWKQNIILADRVDGKALDDFEGSRMVVAGDDLRHSRWIRQVKQIILSRPIVSAP